MKIRSLVADDHSVVLTGLRVILEENGCDVVGTVEDGHALVAAAATLKPDVIVLDISMPMLNGIEAARQIRANDVRVKLIFLSMHTDAPYVREAFRAGGNAYLLKTSAASELATAVREVVAGRNYVSPRLTHESVASLLGAPGPNTFGQVLNQRQREVLQLVAEGKTGKEIARVLHISTKTVEYHKANIMSVLGVRTIAELTRYAIQQKITAN